MRFVTGLAATLVAASQLVAPGGLARLAHASPVNARVSTEGLDFVRDRMLELVPRRLDLEPLKADMFACEGEDASFELQQGRLDLTVNKLEIKLPQNGVIRVELDLTIGASGKAHFEKLYFCYGRETCDANISLKNARATIDLAPSIDAQGKAKVEIARLDVQLRPADVSIRLSNCPEDEIVNVVVGFVKDYGLQLGVLIATNLAHQKVGPIVEGLVQGFLSYTGDATVVDLQTSFTASLLGIDISTTGLQVRGDLDITSRFPAAACIGNAPPEPTVRPGATPDLGAGTPSHLGLAVNFGLVEDVLYHVWHEGKLCVTPHGLRDDYGIDLDALNELGHILPGFPEGTKFSFEGRVAEPPRVEGNVASAAKLTVHVNKLQAALYANLPSGSTRSLKLEADASVSVSLVMDPRINALALQVDGVKVDRMHVNDNLGLSELGFDFGRIRTLLETTILPEVLGHLGQIPITGPVFGGIEGVPIYVILKELKTTPAYLVVKADLFKAPDNDREPPTTKVVEKPTKIVRPIDAKLLFGGSDAQIPSDLLRYRIVVDGRPLATEPTFVRQIAVGEAGRSHTVHVRAHAVDLAGNEDPTGVSVMVEVDGVPPVVQLKSQLRGTVDTLHPSIAWSATDDRTAPEGLTAQVVVHAIPARSGEGPEVEVMNEQLGAGKTSATLEGLEARKQYRVVLSIRDQAGNEAATTQIFAVSADAASGGCAVGGGAGGAGAGILVLALLVAGRIRRRA
jgi:hypothetical protein